VRWRASRRAEEANMRDVLTALALALALQFGATLGCDADGDADADGDGDGDGDTACLDGAAVYQENSQGRAVAPATKEANDFGLYDMLGNAVEWVSDCYHDTYEGAPTDGASWDEATCEYRIVRGGCYGSTPRALRVSVRNSALPSFYGACAPGIRCVRAVGAETPETALVELTWIEVPAGTFEMGCSPGDDQCADNESPTHSVSVEAFEINDVEVTQQQYRDQTGEAPATYVCPECAVTYVSWDAAGAFCEAMGGRLPTEAEWEYAARGGSTGRYYCSD
jgi:formylglycine-generating enzyme required for sulfatase activity